jgi:peptidoglycan/LPS O-acetylase OafA/YrhL
MPTRLLDLQALRGLACLLVLLYHAAEWERLPVLDADCCLLAPFRFFGYAGVDLFFVLSGFVLTWAHADHLGRPAALLSYTARRLWRIYPAYWVCWLVAALPRLHRQGAGEAASYLLLLPRQGTEPFPQGSLQAGNLAIPQSWTLVYELMFYLLFACFFLLPRRCFLPLLFGWFLAAAFAVFRPELPFLAGLPLQPLVLEFLLGCFAALIVRRGTNVPAGGCIVLGVVWFAVGGCLHAAGLSSGAQDPRHRVLAFGIPAALLVGGLTARERAASPLLPRWLLPLGDASYSIYLTHVLVFGLVFKRTLGLSHRPLPHLLWLVLMLGAALAAGYLFHLGVERPLLRWRRRAATFEIFPARTRTSDGWARSCWVNGAKDSEKAVTSLDGSRMAQDNKSATQQRK